MADVTEKLAEALRWIADYPHTHDSHLIAMRNGAREALAAYEAAQAMSPKFVSGTSARVAWRVWRGDSYELFFNEEAAKRRCECFIRQGKPEPLYAAPVAQTEPRKPLTLDEVIALAAVEFHSKHWQAIERLTRAVEKHHGIKEQP